MIGTSELILVVIVVIILFGSSKIPELARSLGKASGEFKKAKQESELEMKDFEKSIKESKSQVDKSSKIRTMASDFGIAIEGKSDEQLLDEIQKKMPTVESEK